MANLNNLTISSGVTSTVSGGETGAGLNVLSGAKLVIMSGGTLLGYSNTIRAGATVSLAPGGIISGQPLLLGVMSGGTVSGGYSYVKMSAGSIARGVSVLSQGALYCSSGAKSLNPRVLSGGTVYIFSGGYASGSVTSSGGRFAVWSGGTAEGGVVQSGGFEYVYAGGVTRNAVIASGGTYSLLGSGSLTENITCQSGGTLLAGPGAILSGSLIQGGGQATLDATAQLDGTTTLQGAMTGGLVDGSTANLRVSGGGVATGVSVQSSGIVSVVGGVVSGGTAYAGGQFNVIEGVTQGVTIASGGSVIVASATGTATQTIVNQGGVLSATSGTVISGSTANTSGRIIVDSNGTASDSLINAGGSLSIGADGVMQGGTIANGGVAQLDATVSIKGTANVAGTLSGGQLVDADAAVIVGAGGLTSGVAIHNGSMTVQAGGITADTLVDNGGLLSVAANGIMQTATIGSGGTAQLDPAAIIKGLTTVTGTLEGGTLTDATASLIVGTGGMTSGVAVHGGSMTVQSGATAQDCSVYTGGNFTVLSGGRLSGVLTLFGGASATIDGLAGGTINMADASYAKLVLTGTVSPTVIITGFNGVAGGGADQIALPNIARSSIAKVSYPDADHVTLTLTDGSSVTLHIVGVEAQGYSLGSAADGSTIYTTCFLAGSMIDTPSGRVAVETLTIGDLVHSVRNGRELVSRITMTGKGHVEVATHLDADEAGYPVRIKAHSLGRNMPDQDLVVTAEHCLYLDGYLIPARMLVNGTSIVYDTNIVSFEYYHFATEAHSIVRANNILTESYLDTGNSAIFDTTTQEKSENAPRSLTWSDSAAAPLAVSRAVVEPIWRTISDNASPVRPAPAVTTTDPALRLVTASGKLCAPIRRTAKHYVFCVPAGESRVSVQSRTAKPSVTEGAFVDDRRRLGVLVGQILVYGSSGMSVVTSHLEDESLSGWHEIDDTECRWTTGLAALPVSLCSTTNETIIALEIKASGPYVDQEPEGLCLGVADYRLTA